MADITIDVSDTDGSFEATNNHGFDITLSGCGLTLDLNAEQAESIYRALSEFYGDDDVGLNEMLGCSHNGANMGTAEIVEVFDNKVWVEHDFMGDAHVMLQSTASGSEPKCAVTVRYAYPYIDNAARDQIATRAAEMLGAVKPIEFRFRELQPNA